MRMAETPLVKGVWFVTARRHLLEEHGTTKLADVARAMKEPHRTALLEAMPSTWYPEDVFQDALHAVMQEVAHHDVLVFSNFIEACTVLGVNTFFRVLLRITSPAFLMRQMPALGRQYRKNDWKCVVEADERRAILRWSGCSYLADRAYRLYVVAMLVKCAELCTGQRPRCDVLEHGQDSATVQVVYR
jgi:hypothetical protein